MVMPAEQGRFTLPELQRCGLGMNIVDAAINLRKLVAWEGLSCQKAAGRATHLRGTKDWDLFMASHYRRLVEAEEEKEADEDRAGEDALTA